jgi:hypothetical protein
MTLPIRVAAALLVSGVLATELLAQTPPAGSRNNPAQPYNSSQPMRRQSIVQHYPYPYPGAYHGDESGGFRNPGGTGRYLEYYPPGNQFQVAPAQDAVRVATFGGGGIPDRNEQLAAQRIGISRYNSIQGHIDRMAQPSFGYGFFGGMY